MKVAFKHALEQFAKSTSNSAHADRTFGRGNPSEISRLKPTAAPFRQVRGWARWMVRTGEQSRRAATLSIGLAHAV